jgi:hypothetical protein
MRTPPEKPLRLVVQSLDEAQNDSECGHMELQSHMTSSFIKVVQGL